PWRIAAGPLEVPLALAVFHGGLGGAVVRAAGAALRDTRGGDLADDVVQRRRVRGDGSGAGHVADGAIAHHLRRRALVREELDVLPDGHQHAVPLEDLALVGE